MENKLQIAEGVSGLHVAAFVLIVLPYLIAACATVGFGAVEMGIEPTPTPKQLTYSNTDMGFAFSYPDTWELEQGDQFVILHQGTATLRIDYARVDEQERKGYFGRSGVPAGDFIYSGKANFLGEEVPIQSLVYELKYKADFYNGTNSIERDGLSFVIVLEDLSIPYENVAISEAQREDARAIVESFDLLDTGADQNQQDLD
jgi:hypothetical protein